MKTVSLFVTLFALAISAQAATINWAIGGSTSYVLTDVNGNPYANQTIYLISAADIASITDPDNLTKDSFETALSAITIATAQSSSTGTKPTYKNEVSSTMMTAGSSFSFGMLVFSQDNEFGYYKVLTGNGTPFADDAPATGRNATITTAWNTLGGKSWTKAYAVPEPSTAVLALAGLALLLKRRRA